MGGNRKQHLFQKLVVRQTTHRGATDIGRQRGASLVQRIWDLASYSLRRSGLWGGNGGQHSGTRRIRTYYCRTLTDKLVRETQARRCKQTQALAREHQALLRIVSERLLHKPRKTSILHFVNSTAHHTCYTQTRS